MDKNTIKFQGCLFFLSSVKRTSKWVEKDNNSGVSVLDLDGVRVHCESAEGPVCSPSLRFRLQTFSLPQE